MAKRLPILCYHKVGPVASEGRFLNVEPSLLDAHIRFFQRRGTKFVTAKELFGDWPDRGVCLTFDDAYLSTLTLGVEVMERRGVRASIYAVADLVGTESSWDDGRARPLADWDLLVMARDKGFEIGNHTARHVRLAELDSAALHAELARSRAVFLDRGFETDSICYPYGSVSDEVVRVAGDQGIGVGLTLHKRMASLTDPRLALPRLTVAYGDRLPLLLYRLYVRPRLRR